MDVALFIYLITNFDIEMKIAGNENAILYFVICYF